MSDRQRRFTLTDEDIGRALRPGADVVAPADLVVSIGAAIAGRPQRGWRRVLSVDPWYRRFGVAGQVALLLLLALALTISVILVGSRREPPIGGGPLMIAQVDTLSMIDSQSGETRTVVDDSRGIFGVARSMNGAFVSFWTGTRNRPGTSLEVVRVDGRDRRVLAADVTPAPVGRGSIDVWSTDDRYLAAAVTADDAHRILVVDVATGEGRLIGPDDGADNPLWSPDAEWLVFTHEQPNGRNTLATMRRDGSQIHDISSNLQAAVSGPDNWSSDGRWVYFDAHTSGSDVYRVDVDSLVIDRLTDDHESAAPALSPDDRLVAFMDWRDGASVWLMNADGSEPRPLVPDADLRGWSSDGHYVLVVTRTPGGPVRLIAVTPDRTDERVLLSQPSCGEPCLEYLSWGWPRP